MSATVIPERWQGFNFLFKTKGKNELNFKMQILKRLKKLEMKSTEIEQIWFKNSL